MTICRDCGRTINETYIFCPWCGKSRTERVSNLSEKEKIEIKSLRRGECLTFVGDEHILINIEASEFEKEIIK